MTYLGHGLSEADQNEDALTVMEAELSLLRRHGDSEDRILATQSNLACTYVELGRLDEANLIKRDVYFGRLKLFGEEHAHTLSAATNYASSLTSLGRFEEAKALSRKMTLVARRVLRENHDLTLKLRWNYGVALYRDTGATLDDLREAVTTLEDTDRTSRRVLGGAHPLAVAIGTSLQNARAALAAREAPPTSN